jgi:hypothetical protein
MSLSIDVEPFTTNGIFFWKKRRPLWKNVAIKRTAIEIKKRIL